MMKIDGIKIEKEEESNPISESKEKDEEIKVEGSVSKQETHSVVETTSFHSGIIDGNAFNIVKFEITEIEDGSGEIPEEESSKEPGFKCIYCEKFFHARRLLSIHHWRMHRGFPSKYTGGSIQCQLCEKVCNDVEVLKVHVQEIHPVEKVFECSLCEWKFEALPELKKHMIIHMPERPFHCNFCPKTFKSRGDMRSHLRIRHAMENVQCPRCPETFKSRQMQRDHMITVHVNGGTFACEKCGKILKCENGLRYHMASKHSIEKPTSCPICLRVFKHKITLNEHIRVHRGKGDFKCHHCPKIYKQNQSLQLHLKTHETIVVNKPYVCDVCNKGFKKSSELKRHSEIHNEAKIKCQQCPKIFRGKIQLRQHVYFSHSGECSCPICGKVLANKASLTKHNYLHTRSLFQCHLCLKTYKRKEFFLNHLILMHKMTKEDAAGSIKTQPKDEKTHAVKVKEEPNEPLESILVKTEYNVE